MIPNKNPQGTCLGITIIFFKKVTKQLPKVFLQRFSFAIP